MTMAELVKGMTYLGIAYGKEYTQDECAVYYDFLKEYSYPVFQGAIKQIVKASKFLPKVAELVEACEESKIKVKIQVIGYMDSHGYFKDICECAKATAWIETGHCPEWLQEDINRYYNMMKQEALSAPEKPMLQEPI